ncbi:hypothetical protein RUM44_003610 [Polyplax serrata]|uniref:Uncharacterized protein n=1 Tax=Polyplax serrata TaxID=468196 RepID=A0ABR1AGZ2_POLSC
MLTDGRRVRDEKTKRSQRVNKKGGKGRDTPAGHGTWRKDEEELKPEQMTGNDDEGGTTDEHKQIRLGEELCRRVQT